MRGRGGFIGANVTPASAAINSPASGVWTVREAESLKRAGTWPRLFQAPTEFTGLQLWLDASDASTLFNATTGGSLVAADGTVKRWADKSGNNRHATEATNGPTRKASQINNLDALQFNGTSNFLQGSSSPASGNTRTVFIVGKSNLATGSELFQIGLYRATGFCGFLLRQLAVGNDWYVSGDVSTNNCYVASRQLTITSPFLACVRQSSTTSLQYFHNRTSYNVVGSLGSFQANPGYFIGKARSEIEDLTFWGGSVGEVIVYDYALSDTDRAAVEAYLIAKWGIA